jgi:LacI family transcriptional regulator
MAVKLKDVAQAAGVAINTASSILNARKDSWASEETKKKVRDAAERLGYTPNRLARGLSLGKFNTIGLIIPNLQNPFYSELVAAIETELIQHDYELIIEDTRLDFRREQECLSKITNRQIDGIIINPINPDIFKSHLEPLNKAGTPVIVLGGPPENSGLGSIQVNMDESVNEAFSHLADLGHRNIGFVFHDLAPHEKATPRVARFKKALKQYDLKSSSDFIVQCKPTLADARNAFAAMLKQHPKSVLPTAFVCLNDLLAIGAMRAAAESSLKIPHDISFIGVDNIPLAEFLPVSLTTIAQPIHEMAVHAVNAVLEIAKTPSKTILSSTLIIRESTGPARQQQ